MTTLPTIELYTPSEQYHCEEIWDDTYQTVGYRLLLDEHGNPIPLDQCICAAHSPSECACGAWSSDDYWDDLEFGKDGEPHPEK